MAGTLSLGMTGALNGDVQLTDFNIDPITITLTNGRGGNPGVVDFTTSEADISFGSMTGKLYVQIWNIGAANKVRVGPKSGGAMVQDQELDPGEWCQIVVPSGVTLRARSDTGTATALIRAFN